MIYVNRSTIEAPEVLANNNINPDGEKNRAIRYFEFNEGNPVNFSIYGHTDVRQDLVKLFKGKCAYCESSIVAASHPHIEHWRPKKGVTEDEEHLGYYWLASEWDNLFLACSQCNSQKYKGNHFPLEINSNYARKSTDVIQELENPLLLNPFIDDPRDYLEFTFQGTIHSQHLKGETSIRVYGLDRTDLTLERTKFANIVRSDLDKIITTINETANLLAQGIPKSSLNGIVKLVETMVEDLKLYINTDFQYSAMSKYLIEKYREEQQSNKIFLYKTKSLVE